MAQPSSSVLTPPRSQPEAPGAIKEAMTSGRLLPAGTLSTSRHLPTQAGGGTGPLVSLTLRRPGAAAQAEAFVYFQTGATARLDQDFDVRQPGHKAGEPGLTTLAPPNEALVINGLPETALTAGTMVPLVLDLPGAGPYELTVGQWANLAGQSVVLIDNLTSSRIDLRIQPTYSFAVSRAGDLVGRFWLEFNGRRLTNLETEEAGTPIVLYPNPTTTEAGFRVLDATGKDVQLLDAMGRVVHTAPVVNGSAELATAGLAAGVYVVRCGTATRRLVVE